MFIGKRVGTETAFWESRNGAAAGDLAAIFSPANRENGPWQNSRELAYTMHIVSMVANYVY